jgi:SOS-response transcriptional repressor LexA
MLCFIAGYIEHHGYAPCLREMAAALGLASKSGLRGCSTGWKRAG